MGHASHEPGAYRDEEDAWVEAQQEEAELAWARHDAWVAAVDARITGPASDPDSPPTILCPHCGHDRFQVGRAIRVWQTLTVQIDEMGGYTVDDDELHDTLDAEPFEEAECLGCGTDVPMRLLFPD